MYLFSSHLSNFLNYFSSGIKVVWGILGHLVMPSNISNLSYYGFWGLALTVVCLTFLPGVVSVATRLISKS